MEPSDGSQSFRVTQDFTLKNLTLSKGTSVNARAFWASTEVEPMLNKVEIEFQGKKTTCTLGWFYKLVEEGNLIPVESEVQETSMRSRDQIESASLDAYGRRHPDESDLDNDKLILEVLLDIRDQNEQTIQLLKDIYMEISNP